MRRNARRVVLAVGLVAACGAAASGQSLFMRGPVSGGGEDPAASLRGISMMAVQMPEPRSFDKHDLITIVIDETQRSQSRQALETEKRYDTRADIGPFVDPLELLELRLREVEGQRNLVRAGARRNYEGEGEYERSDRFTARITARVLEVKPNGTLLLEARKQITRDGDEQTLVLSGLARTEDVTDANTVLSSQMAELRVILEHEGDLKNASKKGFIPRVLDSVFNF